MQKISVVVPVFNEETFLLRCLQSLRSQDYPGEQELIIVDNGSTDASAKIARDFGVKVISCPEKGVAFARQMGAYAATGDVIVQADADTVYSPDWLSQIGAHFTKHEKTAALAGAFIYLDPPWWGEIEYFSRRAVNVLSTFFIGKVAFVSGANFAFRREAFLKAAGYDASSLYPDQWGIASRLGKTGKVDYDPTLTAATSSRRIQKPVFVVFGEFIRNFSGVMAHFGRSNITFLKGLTGKLRQRRSPARFLFAIPLIVIAVAVYGYFAPGSQVFGKIYFKETTPQKVMAITFDDGPNEPYTSEILAILKSHGVHATFFAIGKNVEQYPDTAKQIIADGNALENHSYSHNPNHAITDAGADDVAIAQDVIAKITGVFPHLYRPPNGRKSPWELDLINHDNLQMVTWSDAANDQHFIGYWGKPTPEDFAKSIVAKARPGGIILLHDGYGLHHGDAKSDKSLAVQALPLIIEGLQKQGYQLVTVPELLDIPAYNN
jgi:peptidoglycan/xylan/chitin deacetylase (PgdA/CDA1 family)